jgi:hypothetical protein
MILIASCLGIYRFDVQNVVFCGLVPNGLSEEDTVSIFMVEERKRKPCEEEEAEQRLCLTRNIEAVRSFETSENL